jgi:cell division septal protein FtsQ
MEQKPVMNKKGCLWALFFSMIFWLAVAFILWGIL